MHKELQVGSTVRLELTPWIAREKGLLSREIEGVVKRVTSRAVLVDGHVTVRESRFCLNCSREITNSISILVGFGPICSDRLGIPRPEQLTPEVIEAVKARIAHETQAELWLPQSQIKSVAVITAASTQTVEVARKVQRLASQFYVHGGQIIVKSQFQFKDVCKSVAGARWDGTRKAWTYPASDTTAQALVDAFTGVDTIETDDEFQKLLDLAETRRKASLVKVADELPDVPNSKTAAWHHQKQAFWFARDLPAAYLAMGMGSGKSKVAVDLAVDQGAKKILILAPLSVVDDVWPGQFETHAGTPYHVVPLGEYEGSVRKTISVKKKTEKAKAGLAYAEQHGYPVVFIINYQSAWKAPFGPTYSDDNKRIIDKGFALSQEWDLVILDEAHRVKSPRGRWSLFCAKLGEVAKRRLCLSGTPQPHSPLDVFAQYRFLDRTIYGTSFTRFRARYAMMGGYLNKQVLGYQNEDELNEKFYSIAFRVETEDVLDLPEQMHETRVCALSPKAKKIYQAIDNDLWAKVGDGEITVTNALTQLLRLRQLTGGFVKNDDGVIEHVDTSKGELLVDLLEDLAVDEPLVIFCTFHEELDYIKQIVESSGATGEGGTKRTRRFAELSGRKNELADWKAGRYDVIGVQIQAGNAGIDLTRARYAVYYSMTYSLGDYEQSLKRIHRPGQERNTTYYHFIAEGTVDRKVYKALEQRKNIIATIFEERFGDEHSELAQQLELAVDEQSAVVGG